MADAVLRPGMSPVVITDRVLNVAPMQTPGTYVFSVVAVDDAGLTGTATFIVRVNPGTVVTNPGPIVTIPGPVVTRRGDGQ